MSARASHGRAASAKSAPERNCGRRRKELRSVAAIVAQVAREQWGGRGLKLNVELAYRMQSHPRTADNVLEGRFDPSGELLFNLINSDIGVEIVRAMTAQSQAACWRRFRRTAELANLRRDHASQARRLSALELEAGDG